MRVLAIETSTNQGSIALMDQNELVHETVLPSDLKTTQTLAPAMDAAFNRVDWIPSDIDLVAVTNGPGSFTGLRIAVTAAKTFAYAAGTKLIAFNTLQVLVEQLPDDVADACAVMNAQRRQLFASRYRRAADSQWEVIVECHIIDRDALAELLVPETVLTGPVLERLTPPSLKHQQRAELDCWMPRASTVGRLAGQAHEAGRSDELLEVQPQYYRPSYAEE